MCANRHGSFVTLLRQTKAFSQDDNISRSAANCLGNELNHVLSALDEDPFAGGGMFVSQIYMLRGRITFLPVGAQIAFRLFMLPLLSRIDSANND